MLRVLTLELMIGLAGFTLGAAALLLMPGNAPGAPTPHGDTNLVAIATT